MQMQFTPNKVRIDGDAAYLTLTTGKGIVVGEAIIDLDDLGRVLAAGRWYGQWNPQANTYYVRCNRSRPLLLHRFVMNAPSGTIVDHLHHETLDCRKSVLRVCSHTENMQNRKGAHKNSKSGIRGVYWDNRKAKWRVEVRAHKTRHYLGDYDDIEEAARVAAEARTQLHGDFSQQYGQ